MSPEKKLEDLFQDTLRGIYFAEKQILNALPKMAKAAEAPELSATFEKHLLESEVHIERLEQVFEVLSWPARGKTCDAILGLLHEGRAIMEGFKGSAALDAGLILAGQAVEHHEVARYSALRTWAHELHISDAARLLDSTLAEEIATDEVLTRMAERDANRRAA
jgi:ferritin-like metal-binding protein YciE